MGDGIVPDKSCRRVSNGIDVGIFHTIGIATGESGKGSFQVISNNRGCGPLMTVRTDRARTISVIEQDKFADELVLVGCDVVAKNAERRIAIASWDVAE